MKDSWFDADAVNAFAVEYAGHKTEEGRNKLCLMSLPICEIEVSRLSGTYHNKQDAKSYAHEALLTAIDHYNPAGGAKFTTYAWWLIHRMVIHYAWSGFGKSQCLVYVNQYHKYLNENALEDNEDNQVTFREKSGINIARFLDLYECLGLDPLQSFPPQPVEQCGENSDIDHYDAKEWYDYQLARLPKLRQDILRDWCAGATYSELGKKYQLSRTGAGYMIKTTVEMIRNKMNIE